MSSCAYYKYQCHSEVNVLTSVTQPVTYSLMFTVSL